MTIQVTITTTFPKGVSPAMFKPQYKHLYDMKNEILRKHMDPTREVEVSRTDDDIESTYTTVVKSYYNSVEDYNNCMTELQLSVGNIGASLTEMDKVALSRRKRTLQVVDLETNELLKDIEMGMDGDGHELITV